jgi:predicted nucleic acid-binding protein
MADVRAEREGESNVSPADAIHLATASVAHVDVYLTNDSKLRKLVVDGI